MSSSVDIRILELLAARLCHELISPVGAIANGVELLGEDDPEFVRQAVDLIGQSARKASQRLQFYRFAYGTLTAGSAGPGNAAELVAGLLEGGKVDCTWSGAVLARTAEWHRLACNMVVVATEALPRGGSLRVEPAASGSGLVVAAQGATINFTAEAQAALARTTPPGELTSRTVHAYVTSDMAARLGAPLVAAVAGDRLTLTAASA